MNENYDPSQYILVFGDMATSVEKMVTKDREFVDEDACSNDYLYFGVDELTNYDFLESQRQMERIKMMLKRAS